METKKCNKCLLDLDKSMFTKNSNTKDGLMTRCKSCIKEFNEKNKEKKKEYDKIYSQKNKEKLKEQRKIYYPTIKERYKDYFKEYNQLNSETLKNKKREYDKANIEKKKEYFINRRKTNPIYNLSCFYRSMLNNAFRQKGYVKNEKCLTILGCTFEEFKLYIESKFEDWMTWENKGNPKDGVLEINKTWDIDHIIPLSSAKTENDITNLNHYTNLQPLCSYTNRNIKKDKQWIIE